MALLAALGLVVQSIHLPLAAALEIHVGTDNAHLLQAHASAFRDTEEDDLAAGSSSSGYVAVSATSLSSTCPSGYAQPATWEECAEICEATTVNNGVSDYGPAGWPDMDNDHGTNGFDWSTSYPKCFKNGQQGCNFNTGAGGTGHKSDSQWTSAACDAAQCTQDGKYVGCSGCLLSLCQMSSSSPADKNCIGETTTACQGNLPCVDLREADNHHHPMWLNADGTAHIGYTSDQSGNGVETSGRSWTATCTSNCAGNLVGTWTVPGFYGGTITITADYADDFTDARSNDFVQFCSGGGTTTTATWIPAETRAGCTTFCCPTFPYEVTDSCGAGATDCCDRRAPDGSAYASVDADGCKGLCEADATCGWAIFNQGNEICMWEKGQAPFVNTWSEGYQKYDIVRGSSPTCSDGVQNQDETGVDCGGSSCSACPTCSDGVENQDETGVDCGGSSCSACTTTTTTTTASTAVCGDVWEQHHCEMRVGISGPTTTTSTTGGSDDVLPGTPAPAPATHVVVAAVHACHNETVHANCEATCARQLTNQTHSHYWCLEQVSENGTSGDIFSVYEACMGYTFSDACLDSCGPDAWQRTMTEADGQISRECDHMNQRDMCASEAVQRLCGSTCNQRGPECAPA